MRPVLELHADDLGSSLPCSLGILDCHDAGAIDGASLMVTRPEVLEKIADKLAARPNLQLALHLNLTEGRPVSPARQLDALCDDKAFRHSFLSLARLYALATNQGRACLQEQLSQEIESQIVRFDELLRLLGRSGQTLLVDSHEHLHFLPFLRRQLLALRSRYPLIVRREPARLRYLGDLGDSRRARNLVLQAGLNLLLGWAPQRELSHRQLWTGTVDPRRLQELAGMGEIEVLFHPARETREKDLDELLQPRQKQAYLSPIRTCERTNLLKLDRDLGASGA